MENKINIAELLKDCPSGMELDCTVYDNVTLGSIMDGNCYPIQIQTPEGNMLLSKYGCMSLSTHSKCVIFPKGKTTWEGFQRPFKDGDILTVENESNPFIFYCDCDGFYNVHCALLDDDFISFTTPNKWTSNHRKYRLATEEEKQKLFEAIKDNGYKWNAETKTLEKLVIPKFKVGDVIQDIDTYKVKITEVSIEDECYEYESMDIKGIGSIGFSEQDNWELVPNKFDINTLKPFDKVLVRDGNKDKWNTNFYGFYDIKYDIKFPYECCGNSFAQCIPYEGNEHLLGTTDDCDKFYKNW